MPGRAGGYVRARFRPVEELSSWRESSDAHFFFTQTDDGPEYWHERTSELCRYCRAGVAPGVYDPSAWEIDDLAVDDGPLQAALFG